MTKVTKIVCTCGYQNAEVRIDVPDGMITVNRKAVVTYSEDSTVKIGDSLSSFFSRIQIEDYLGECPKCEGEACIRVFFVDGTVIRDPEVAIKKM